MNEQFKHYANIKRVKASLISFTVCRVLSFSMGHFVLYALPFAPDIILL